jgi:pimeloyl-ACP methyl ester carboxylesterase
MKQCLMCSLNKLVHKDRSLRKQRVVSLHLILGLLSICMPALVVAQPSVVQVVSAQSPNCFASPCIPPSLTVSFAPTGVGHIPLLIFDHEFVPFSSGGCVDNTGQQWSESPIAGFWSPVFNPRVSPNSSGLTSVTCSIVATAESVGFSSQFVGQTSLPVQCGTSPVSGLGVWDVTSTAFNPTPDTLTPLVSGLTQAANLFQNNFSKFYTEGVFYGFNGGSSSPPSFSFLHSLEHNNGLGVSCSGISFSGPQAMVDPYPDLMNGTKMVSTTDQGGVNTLATLGRRISGVAADGVTQILLKIPARSVGSVYSVNINDLRAVPPMSEVGAVGIPGDTSPNITRNVVSVSAVETSGGPYAFAVYRAPLDFNRGAGQDDLASSRTITVSAIGENTGQDFDITIVRPPVVLIHGLWGNWQDAWNNFAPLVTGANRVDPRFSVLRANYDGNVGSRVTSTDPAYPKADLPFIRANSLGVGFNAANVLGQMSQWLSSFRTGSNPAGVAVAAAQFDVVAHSMGGLIARTLPLLSGNLKDWNFRQGVIHKSITIDTPHLGSPVASLMVAAGNECTRNWLAGAGSHFAIGTAVIDQTPVSGAVGDLIPGSASLQALQALNPIPNTPPVPTALIAGQYTNWASLDDITDFFTELTIGLICKNDPIIQRKTSSAWPAIFGDAAGDNRNDGLVSVVSQINAVGNGTGFVNVGFVHASALTGVTGLGFTPPSVLDPNTDISRLVIQLLNTSVTDPLTFNKLGPASQ